MNMAESFLYKGKFIGEDLNLPPNIVEASLAVGVGTRFYYDHDSDAHMMEAERKLTTREIKEFREFGYELALVQE